MTKSWKECDKRAADRMGTDTTEQYKQVEWEGLYPEQPRFQRGNRQDTKQAQ